MALKIRQLPLPSSPQRTSARRDRIAFTVAHHMTVIGNGDGRANTTCRTIWRTREASAHYGVDGQQVAQFVPDGQAAWATANVRGNHAGISIEHANSTGGPSWKLSTATLDTGARLTAELHDKHGLGRPRPGVTMLRHSDFFPTACPGPWFAGQWATYCQLAQAYYDNGTNTPERTWSDMATKAEIQKAVEDALNANKKLDQVWDNMPQQKGVKSNDGVLAAFVKTAARNAGSVDVNVDAGEIADAVIAQLGDDLAAQVVANMGAKLGAKK